MDANLSWVPVELHGVDGPEISRNKSTVRFQDRNSARSIVC